MQWYCRLEQKRKQERHIWINRNRPKKASYWVDL